MAKHLIYTVNNSGAAVPIGNTVPVGSIIRRAGSCIDATGSAINLSEPGYYLVNLSATFTAAMAGNVTLQLQQDGVNIPGATGTETIVTANTEVANIAFNAIVRVLCCGTGRLSVLVGGTAAPTLSNMGITVVRIA